MRGTLRERLAAHLVPCADDGCECLLWPGDLTPDGYGRIKITEHGACHRRAVHRVAWELENGPVSDGLVLDHVRDRGCRHKNCANLAHLEPVTPRVNILRGSTLAATRATQTHCLNGHPFDPVNTYWHPSRGRVCRACRRASDRRRYLAAHPA